LGGEKRELQTVSRGKRRTAKRKLQKGGLAVIGKGAQRFEIATIRRSEHHKDRCRKQGIGREK